MTRRQSLKEIELKLRIAPDAIRRLAGCRLLRGTGRPVSHRLWSIYYDTPGLDLLRQRIALRTRRENGVWV